jgi:hypothetical protein
MDAVQAATVPLPRSRRWPWILALVVGLVLILGITVPVVVVFGVATAADKGAGCAQCAARDWVNYLGSMWWDTDGETYAAKDAAPQRRSALMAQRRAYIAQIRADIARFPVVAGTDFDASGATPPVVSGGDDAATVVLQVTARWPNTVNGGLWFYSDPGTWRFEVRRDHTGWRIWHLDSPPWCGTYSRCAEPPPPLPTASPTPTPDDPLASLRPMLPCGPRDPFRQWHSCPPTSPAS